MAKFSEPLHTLHFNVTNTCNLSCSFCYSDAVKAKTTVLPLNRIQLLASEAREVGCRRVILSGGEIFTRKDWLQICQAFAAETIAVSLVSNGTLLSDDRVEQLATVPEVTILVSLDGSAPVHDRIRGVKGSHDTTVQAIRQLRSRGVSVQINSTIIKSNLSEVLYLALLSLDLDLSIRFSLLNRYNGRGVAVAPDALDMVDILYLREFCHEARSRGSKVFLNVPPLMQHPEDVLPIRSPACGWTRSYCGVTNDGDVTICGVAGKDKTLHQANILDKPFSEIWTSSPLFEELRSLSTDDLKGVCGVCKFRHSCGGACRLSAYKGTGDFTAPYSLCQVFFDAGLAPPSAIEQRHHAAH